MIKKISRIFLVLLILFIGFIIFSPIPVSMLINKAFEGGIETKSPDFDELAQQTSILSNENYHSKYPNGLLDIISPKEANQQTPTIFWMHGGAYVGGDKTDLTNYATMLAGHGYRVISINYALAPKEHYPVPITQLGEAYSYIKENAAKYEINMDNIYFAGDSAGAQMVSQFVAIQTNPAYAEKLKIDPLVEPSTIKGSLLFCGPYNLEKLTSGKNNVVINFFFKRVGWAYVGDYNWENSEKIKNATILDDITSEFPATFLTDGNKGSFEEHGIELEEKLLAQNVTVDSVFYDPAKVILEHEYQFKMDTVSGQETFDRMLQFLAQTQR